MTSDNCECGGSLKYYDGALGYEAMVCQKCGEHWNDTSKEDYQKHLAEYKEGKRRK